MTTEVQIDDCLGLCQYVTKHLEDQQAIRYLLSVETLTYEDWRRAKELLPGTCVTNKTTIEGNIKEIITVLYNQEIKTRYLVGNLGILPGLNEESLRLMSFVNSTLVLMFPLTYLPYDVMYIDILLLSISDIIAIVTHLLGGA